MSNVIEQSLQLANELIQEANRQQEDGSDLQEIEMEFETNARREFIPKATFWDREMRVSKPVKPAVISASARSSY